MLGLRNALTSRWKGELKHGQQPRIGRKINSIIIEPADFSNSIELGIFATLLLFTISFSAQSACSLSFTSPAAGATVFSPTISVTGTGSGNANPNDVGQVTATLNGAVFFSQSGVFTTLINFLGSGAASVTLQPGANTLVVTGSVSGCSASDTRVVFYDPNPAITKKNQGPSPAMCNGTNPINGGTGNKFQLETDYQGSGNYPLIFQRYYNSKSTDKSATGNFWRSSFSDRLVITPTKISAERASGTAYQFLSQNNEWKPDADINWKLETLANSQWRIIQDNDTEELYDNSGKLLSIQLRNGLGQTLSYDGLGRLAQVIDTFGKSLGFVYASAAANAKLDHIVLPDATEIHYTYLANGNLSQVIHADTTPFDITNNPRKTHHYENILFPGALTGITDENNVRFATWHYDNLGRTISSEHASGGIEKYSLAYATDGNSTSITDPLGTVRTSHFSTVLGVVKSTGSDQPAGSGCAASASNITYDANGNIASRTDFNGHKTCYAYDLARNLETARVEGLPAMANCAANLAASSLTAPARKITTGWHATYRLPLQIAEPEKLTTYSYDAAGNTLTHTQQATTDTNGSAGLNPTVEGTPRTWTYTYNNLGQILTANGPRTDVADKTIYTYDAAGNLATVTNPLGRVTRFSDYDANGRVRTITAPNGVVTALDYTPRGWLQTLTVTGGTNIETTQYTYTPVGLLNTVTQADGSVLTYGYDNAHRLTTITDKLGNKVTYTLDKAGNRINEKATDPANVLRRNITRDFDALNRLQTVTGAEQ